MMCIKTETCFCMFSTICNFFPPVPLSSRFTLNTVWWSKTFFYLGVRQQGHAHARQTHRSMIGQPLSQLSPAYPIVGQSAKPVAIHATEHPSRCAHGSVLGDHATPSRPRLRPRTGGAACVTAVWASGTDGNRLRQHRALWKCPGLRGGGACSGLSARHGPRNSWGYSDTLCEQQCLRAYAFAVAVATFWRNERRMLGSQNGVVFARCRLCHPHRVPSRQGKQSKTRAVR